MHPETNLLSELLFLFSFGNLFSKENPLNLKTAETSTVKLMHYPHINVKCCTTWGNKKWLILLNIEHDIIQWAVSLAFPNAL